MCNTSSLVNRITDKPYPCKILVLSPSLTLASGEKSFIEVKVILKDINYIIPKELEDGFVPEEEYKKQDSILTTTFSDSSGKQYSLGIIFLGVSIVNSYLEVLSINMERKSKHKSKSKKAKMKSKSKGFGKK